MNSVIRGDIGMALASLRSTRWRSLFTMFGVVVAVVPVLTILSIGEGVERQIHGQIHNLGSDLITVRPGVVSESDNPFKQFNNLSGYTTTGTLTEADFKVVKKVNTIRQATPLSVIPGAVTINDRTIQNTFVVATTEDLPKLINHSVQYGEFFGASDVNRRIAVVGRGTAEELFGEGVPLGRAFEFRGENFIVGGVLERFSDVPLSYNTDFNNAIIIPYSTAKDIANNAPIYEILAKPTSLNDEGVAVKDVTSVLSQSRGGQKDFSVITQAENQRIVSRILTLITALVSGVAAIALLVSGISIMNIMLVSVAERMHEIGVRKAIGATRRQIVGQFLAEAVLLSVGGGIIGVALSFVVMYFVRLATELQPVITWSAALLVLLITFAVGVIFGSIPALKAARKHPIDALRHE